MITDMGPVAQKPETSTRCIRPAASSLIEPGALKVELHGVKVNAHDLFTGVSSEPEQRHEGLRVEIG